LLLMVQSTAQGTLNFSSRFQVLFAQLRTRQGAGLGVTVVVALLCLIPFGVYTWHNGDTVILRPSQVAASVGTDSAPTSTVWSGIEHTALMYSPFGTPGDQAVRRNIPGEPVLNLWQALLFFAGLAIALWRVRHPSYAI